MDLEYGTAAEAFRDEVVTFLAQGWLALGYDERALPDVVRRFREEATNAGYLYRGVPKAYGGSEQPADAIRAQVIREEFARAGAPAEVVGNGISMLLPTLLGHGEQWQKAYFLPPTLKGHFVWAQGYSEPDAGSDLASLRTTAVLDGEHWIINGQKVWTSRADRSTHMFLLARTEPDAPKRQGISYLLLEMHQPGITVRPLRQMTGQSEFSEVFFDNAETPANWIVGQRGRGWGISTTTLRHERSTIGGSEYTEQRFQKLVETARRQMRQGRPAIDDPGVRQALAELEGWILAQKFSSYRRFSLALAGRDAGLIGLVQKQLTTEIAAMMAAAAQSIIGDELLLQPAPSAPGVRRGDEKWTDQIMGSLGVAIAGGASNIQRNIIGERGLGLPRDLAMQREQL